MILSDTEILLARKRGEIVIDPWREECLGGNSYDVHLGPVLMVHLPDQEHGYELLDAGKDNPVSEIKIPDDGLVLHPGTLYLAATEEYTETHRHVPYLDGKSSVGRLGIAIHATAGRGDVGFCNHWTMEIFVVQPVKVYAGMPIGQITYHVVMGTVDRSYAQKATTTYGKLPRSPLPQPSRLFTKLIRPSP